MSVLYRTAVILSVCLTAAAASIGCGGTRRVSIGEWQKIVEQYVWDQGNGDPNCLRDTVGSGPKRQFVIFNHPTQQKSTDAVGTLLGHRTVGETPDGETPDAADQGKTSVPTANARRAGGRGAGGARAADSGEHWFVFLVGLVKNGKVDDVRVVGLCAEGGEMRWRVGPRDRKALRAYQRHRRALWREQFPSRGDRPRGYGGFPAEDDAFDLAVAGPVLTATHPASGARWTLDVSAPPQAADAPAEDGGGEGEDENDSMPVAKGPGTQSR